MQDTVALCPVETELSPAAIAALPELLDAAQEALWALDPYAALIERGVWHSDDSARAIAKLRGALAKATSAV